MNLHQIPLGSLRAFEAVGRHCHIRKAAIEMHVSHPALSRHVRQLEQRLGVDLFTREGNKLALTAAGQRLLVSVQAAFEELSQGLFYLDPNHVSGEVVIASTATILMNWLIPVLKDFQAQYPEIQLRLTTIEPRQQELPPEFDVAICLGEPYDRAKTVWWLYEERYMPVCSPQLMQGKSLRQPEELLSYSLMHDNMGHWKKWFLSQGISHCEATQNTYFDYAYQAIEAARMGMGIALADSMEVQRDIESGRLIKVFEDSFTIGQSVYLVADEPGLQNKRAKLAIRAIVDALQSHKIEMDDKVIQLAQK